MSERCESVTGIDFFMNGLCTLCHMAKNELMDFEDFHSETEASWKKINQDLESKIDRIIERHPEDRDEIIENFSLDLHETQEKYPSIHRKSLLITIYSFFENELNDLCGMLSESVSSNVKLADLQGNGIERALLYLSKVAMFDLSKMGKTLPYIKNINIIRNAVVHNGGILPSDPQHKVNVFISNTKGISGSPGRNVRLEASFINEMINMLIQFFSQIDEQVQAHIQMHVQKEEAKKN